MSNEKHSEPSFTESPPPIFKTWGQLYIFVLVFHAIIISLFYLFTQIYA